MNIAGFILFLIFGGAAFLVAKIMKPDFNGNPAEKYLKCNIATVTVKCTETEKDREGKYLGYYYQVEFIDCNGNEAVGKSETFSKKRTIENGQHIEAYYWQKMETKSGRMLQSFVDGTMNAMTMTLFDKPYQPDLRPKYRIHFCDESVYAKEKKADMYSSIACFIFGCAMVVIACVLLFTNLAD